MSPEICFRQHEGDGETGVGSYLVDGRMHSGQYDHFSFPESSQKSSPLLCRVVAIDRSF